MTRTLVIVVDHDRRDEGGRASLETFYANGAVIIGEHFAQECARELEKQDGPAVVAWLESRGYRREPFTWLVVCDDVVKIETSRYGVRVQALATVERDGTLTPLDA